MDKKKASAFKVYARLLKLVKPHYHLIALASFGMILYAATDTAFAALMKPMIDGSFVARDPFLIAAVPALIMLTFLIRGLGGFMSGYIMAWVGSKLVLRLRAQMFAKLLDLPTRVYDNSTSGELVSKLTFNAERVSDSATNALTILIRDILTVIGLMSWMLYLSPQLTIILLVITPFLAIMVVYLAKKYRILSHLIQNSMGKMTHIIEEAIEGHRVVKIFGGSYQEQEKYANINTETRKNNLKLVLVRSISVPVVQFFIATVLAVIVYMATNEGMMRTVTAGTFMSFIIAMLGMFAPLRRLTTINAELQKGIAASDSIFELLDSPVETDQGKISISKARGKITIKNLKFSYAPDLPSVLDDINLEIEAGQTVALVGKSGSGKSTITSILCRLYQTYEGEVLMDDIKIDEVQLAEYRKNISFVGQNVTLFNDTIKNNIAYGKLLSESSDKKIKEAAVAAYADEFIEKLPKKYDTCIGENGILLSGGQRQRLAIARAYLKNAPLLILDEATSSLDSESEKKVQQGLLNLFANRTTLVIAHRLSTIENADKIIVLDQGKIIERGTHQELLAKNLTYANLYKLQFN
ncbi:MAG: lipid A export permease/ATP-binding protein MsbA [Gammaproteobacteria bacterium]|nr:MAG: lipid A export permease/ATP-binding protein MsbA [Gammaproteobacteria bacterium]